MTIPSHSDSNETTGYGIKSLLPGPLFRRHDNAFDMDLVFEFINGMQHPRLYVHMHCIFTPEHMPTALTKSSVSVSERRLNSCL